MVPFEWVDPEEWDAIEEACCAVEQRSTSSSTTSEQCEQPPHPKRVCRQLPASWFAPPAGHSRVKSKLPRLVFRGRIIYCKTFEEVESGTRDLMQDILELKNNGCTDVALGFDIEWKPAFGRGVAPGRTAVLQLCLESSRCYIFHIFHSGIPTALQELLEEKTISKTGVGIRADADKLKLDYSINVNHIVDLSMMANRKLSTLARNWSLSSLAEELTCQSIDKRGDIRCGNWELEPLSQAQLSYAATDAFASLHLYKVLASFSDPAPPQQPEVSAEKETEETSQAFGLQTGKKFIQVVADPE